METTNQETIPELPSEQPKKLKVKKPTQKQAKAIAILAGNGGISVGAAMRKAGYSEISANTPAKLTESVAYQSLAERIDEDLITKSHVELFSQKREATLTFPKFMEDEEIMEACANAGIDVLSITPTEKSKLAIYFVPDAQAKAKAIEMAHKMKGAYIADKTVSPAVINYNLFQQPTFQLQVKGFEEGLKGLLTNEKDPNVPTTQGADTPKA